MIIILTNNEFVHRTTSKKAFRVSITTEKRDYRNEMIKTLKDTILCQPNTTSNTIIIVNPPK
jgi:hypothetical protein